MNFSWKSGSALVFAAVAATVLGKTAGGFVMDKIGALPASVISLGLSSVCFCFSGSAAAGIIAIFLFNLTMPVTLHRAAVLLPEMKGFSFGLLTFALFLGFSAVYLEISLPGSYYAYGAVALASLILMLPGLLLPRGDGK